VTDDATLRDRESSAPPPLPPLLGLALIIIAVGIGTLLLFLPRAGRPPATPGSGVAAAPAPDAPQAPLVSAANGAGGAANPPASPPSGGTPAVPPAAPPTAPPTAPPADEKLDLGLTLRFSGAHGATDQRPARVISLYVGEHESPTPFLEPGAFSATWDGYITLDVWNKLTFSAEGAGAFTLTINGAPVLDVSGATFPEQGKTLRLEKGKNHVVALYKSLENGSGHVRLLWSCADFPAEPVPAPMFTHNINDKPLKLAQKLRRGRELVATLRCTRCHASDATAAAAMPELATDAPDLRDAGGRLNAAWMAAWIADPKSLRANATMPRVLHGADAAAIQAQAADLSAYLTSLGHAEADPALGDKEVVAGGRLFAKLGCVACHLANSDGPAYVDLSALKAKWKPAALAAFLREPTKHYQWIRMPTFGFNADQAKQLAAYLLSREAKAVPAGPAGDAARGKALAAASGCASCHQLGEGAAPALKAPSLLEAGKKPARGCLASEAAERGAAPDFALEGGDFLALRAFLASDQAALKRESLPEFAERRITALRCSACHERDGNDALLTSYSGETDKLLAELPAPPEDPADANDPGLASEGNAAANNPCPLLTFTGDKLRPEWLGAFVAGKIAYRTRPWLNRHMPFFPAGASQLAQGLAEEHGHPPVTPKDEQPQNPPPASIGKELIGQNHGLACSFCHGVGAAAPVAVFEAPGINLGYAASRLQKDFFHRWMRYPTRFDPTTRMTKFASDDGTTPLKDVLGGKADDQFEAVWQYLVEVNKMTDFAH
jgi:cytochrome c2